MIPKTWLKYLDSLWVIDSEYHVPGGEPHTRDSIVCVAGKNILTGEERGFTTPALPRDNPFPTSARDLHVAFSASAEWSTYLALGWEVPKLCVCLRAEIIALTGPATANRKKNLIEAGDHYGVNLIDSEYKQTMRELVLRGAPYTDQELKDILHYCFEDVHQTVLLLDKMAPDLHLPVACYRGRYTIAVSRMEQTGIPMDVSTLTRLADRWNDLKVHLVTGLDPDQKCYERLYLPKKDETKVTLKRDRLAAWIAELGVAAEWPRTDSGTFKTDGDTLVDFGKRFPEIERFRQLKSTLDKCKLRASKEKGSTKDKGLLIGSDDRNRVWLNPWASITSRNYPSNSQFVFGPARWLRFLIAPPPGYHMAYLDYRQQEIGVAASLSGDEVLMEAYRTGDSYLAFAVQSGLAPPGATKKSHPAIRDKCKALVLGMNYGKGPYSLSQDLNCTFAEASELHHLHRRTYSRYWEWSEDMVDRAVLTRKLATRMGWTYTLPDEEVNPRSITNWPVQSTGADILRLACCMLTEAGISVCAPVHDAVLILAPAEEMKDTAARAQKMMEEAAAVILKGFTIVTDCEVYTDRYRDKGGEEMWNLVTSFIDGETQ